MIEKFKTYKKDKLIITWKPNICIHAGNCVKMLPDVYRPNKKPWIRPENATAAELISQIVACPSGALSYEINET